MFVSPRYLDKFCLKFEDEVALLALVPTEIVLNTFEAVGHTSIVLDAPADGDYPAAINLNYQDLNPDTAESWELDAGLRKTLVTIPGHPVGWLFDGLLAAGDARTWFRAKFEIPSPELAI